MNKTLAIGLLVVVLIVLGGGVALLSNQSQTPTNTSNTTNSTTTSGSNSTTGSTSTGTTTSGSTSGSTKETCIITVLGKQYDVQPLRGRHPGGDVFECGTDMTSTFQGQHGGDIGRLEPYKVN